MTVTPPTSAPGSYAPYAICVPDEPEWRQFVWGALLDICDQRKFTELSGHVSPEDTAEEFFLMYETRRRITLLPTGTILEWPSAASIPDGFAECNGQSLDKNDYPELFGVLGYTWGGSGDNFNVPDKREKVSAGTGGSHALASSEGERTHTLTLAEMPAHTHPLSMTMVPTTPGAPTPTVGYNAFPALQTGSQGQSAAHNNMQPTVYTRFMIATGPIGC